MKKTYLMTIIIIFLILSFGCTVNDTTGVVRVRNTTHLPLRNLKIGNTLIVGYLAGGAAYDYWYYSDIAGKLQSEEIPIEKSVRKYKYHFKTGYWIYLTARYDDDGDEVIVIDATEHGVKGDNFDWDDIRD